MEFITIRDLRTRPAEVWEKLRQRQDLVLTSNGKPLAILAGVEETQLEETLAALRRARVQAAVTRLRQAATAQGMESLTAEEIDAEIGAVRAERAK